MEDEIRRLFNHFVSEVYPKLGKEFKTPKIKMFVSRFRKAGLTFSREASPKKGMEILDGFGYQINGIIPSVDFATNFYKKQQIKIPEQSFYERLENVRVGELYLVKNTDFLIKKISTNEFSAIGTDGITHLENATKEEIYKKVIIGV